MFKRFYEKLVYTEDPGLFLNQFFNLCPCGTIHLSLCLFKPPGFFFLPEIPLPFETVTAEVNRVARLTGGEGGPAKGGVSMGSPCGHVEVRLVDCDGRNRSGHVRRQAGSSAACAPVCSRR
jgi:hypothetical protein